MASCRLDPTGLNAALQLDLKVAFPIIDLLLGGEGKSRRQLARLPISKSRFWTAWPASSAGNSVLRGRLWR